MWRLFLMDNYIAIKETDTNLHIFPVLKTPI